MRQFVGDHVTSNPGHSPASSPGPLPYAPELGDLRRSRRATMSTPSFGCPRHSRLIVASMAPLLTTTPYVVSTALLVAGILRPHFQRITVPSQALLTGLHSHTKTICTEPGSRLAKPPGVGSGAERARPQRLPPRRGGASTPPPGAG